MNDDLADAENPNVRTFVWDARSYCGFLDFAISMRPRSLYIPLEQSLASLAGSVLRLPPAWPAGDYLDFGRGADWNVIAPQVDALVNEDVLALIDYEGSNDEAISRHCMLFDDLADIYSDLREGLAIFDLRAPEARQGAIWTWRFNYECHWGPHLFRAMATIHEIRYRLYRD